MKIEELKKGQKILVECEFDIFAGANQAWVLIQGEPGLAQLDDIILDQPKLVVPQSAIDWVDDSRERDYEFDEWFDPDNPPLELYKWLNCKNKRQADINALALVTLIVNGPDAVTVEKEKLYTVEIPNPNNRVEHRHMMLIKTSDGRITLTELIDSHVNLREDIKLTEQQIRKDFDWAWQWKKEVTE